MSNTEQVEFKLTLKSEWWDVPPHYTVLLNDQIIEDGLLEEKQSDDNFKILKFTADLPEGEHVLKVRLLDKTQKQTAIDNDGNILKDQLIHIKQIEIDEIELDFLIWSHSYFHHFKKYENKIPIFQDEPDENKYPTMGFNGEYRLPFSVPTYMWFLENL